MAVHQTEPFPQPHPVPTHRQNTMPTVYAERRSIAILKKTDGFAERISLKQDICARKIRAIQIEHLKYLSPGAILEDYIF